MNNIERFNLYTAHILSTLYENFPMPKELEARKIVDAMKDAIPVEAGQQSDATNFVGHTLLWLSENGFVGRLGEISPFRYVLAPKALEVMNSLPSALQGKKSPKDEKSVGETLVEATKDFGTDIGKEAKKEVVKRIVGEVFGHAARAFMGG